MKSPFRFVALLVLLTGFNFNCGLADEMNGKHDAAPVWLSPSEEQALESQVPPPPATGSPEDQADLAAVLKAQAARTPEVIAEAQADNTFSFALFTKTLGTEISATSNPVTFQFIGKLGAQTREITDAVKDHWKRLRPFEAHPEVKAVVKAKGFSYPSGHSTASYCFATVLGVLFPDNAAALLDRAQEIAQSRVNGGVHNPSDIAEGEVLGKAIAQALLAKPEFQKDLEAAKAELAAGKK